MELIFRSHFELKKPDVARLYALFEEQINGSKDPEIHEKERYFGLKNRIMEWYIPITILPGVGMLIMSTTGQMMSLSNEIESLLSKKCSPFQHKISHKKIAQLSRLTKAATLLYLSSACFVLSGILGALLGTEMHNSIPNLVLVLGVTLVLIALTILINYGFHTITIRKLQHQHNEQA
ncbi:MAG: DUF2721 domain-containing protein [Bacteroidota bacterium]